VNKSFKAYRLFDEGGQVVPRFVDLRLEQLDAGDVVINVQYSSINYKDALAATGAGKIVRRFPCVGGIDLAGTVMSSNDMRFKSGDVVLATGYGLGVNHDGGYAQIARVPGDWLVHVPWGLTALDVMALGTAGFTAALAITRMETNGLAPGNGPVIVTGASGGVGSVAVDILATLGYEVTALTGKTSEHGFLRSLGASKVLDRASVEHGTHPLEASMWAGAVDNLGGEWLAWLTRTMKQRGCIASIGLAAGVDVHTTVLPFILRGVSILGVDSSQTPMEMRRKVWQRLASDMRPPHLAELSRVVEFHELPMLFPRHLDGSVTGRTVVHIAV
jgi:acrylyl-CoA reductase (NADPH)